MEQQVAQILELDPLLSTILDDTASLNDLIMETSATLDPLSAKIRELHEIKNTIDNQTKRTLDMNDLKVCSTLIHTNNKAEMCEWD